MNLQHIAADMRRIAEQDGSVRRRLQRGLAISLHHEDEWPQDSQWTLTIGRTDVFPSTDEALIIASTFGVPPGTDPEWRSLTQRRADGSVRHWYTIAWQWIEAENSDNTDDNTDDEQPHQAALITPPTRYT